VNLAYTRITAPINGIIGLRQVDPGNIVHAGDATGLLVITQVRPISVIFTIPEDQLPQVVQLTRGGKKLVAEAWDRSNTSKLATGTLLTIDNQIDQTTGTVKLKAVFPNKDNALFPNQFVNVRLLVDTITNTTIVPSAAVQHSPTGTFVYVVKNDAVKMQDVSVSLIAGDETALADGPVAEGDLVVTDGIDKPQSGSKITLQNAKKSKDKA